MDRPVVDKTGLAGRFDIRLEFARPGGPPAFRPGGDAPAEPAPPSDEPAGRSIFTAIQKFGLKLESAKGPREFVVIDSLEKPSAN